MGGCLENIEKQHLKQFKRLLCVYQCITHNEIKSLFLSHWHWGRNGGKYCVRVCRFATTRLRSAHTGCLRSCSSVCDLTLQISPTPWHWHIDTRRTYWHLNDHGRTVDCTMCQEFYIAVNVTSEREGRRNLLCDLLFDSWPGSFRQQHQWPWQVRGWLVSSQCTLHTPVRVRWPLVTPQGQILGRWLRGNSVKLTTPRSLVRL